MTAAATFAAVFATLYAAHSVGDHWVQTHRQACGKGTPGPNGWLLCGKHVATLTWTKVLALWLMQQVTGLHIDPVVSTIALAVDAASHYVIDRRAPLLALADRLGKGDFARLGDGMAAPTGTGAYALDQSFHVLWLFIAALIIGGAS